MPATEIVPICAFCRRRDAIGWISDELDTREHERRKESICLSCLESLLERELALALADERGVGDQLRQMLPPLRRGLGAPRIGRPAPVDLETDDRMERLAVGWEAFVEEAEREGRRLDSELEP